MLRLSELFKKKKTDTDETPQSQSFLQKYWPPLLIGCLCILLVGGYVLKYFLVKEPETAPEDQTYDCTATLAAVGDISVSTKLLRAYHTDSETYEFGECFRQIAQTVSSADLAVGNLEGSVSNDVSKSQNSIIPEDFLTALSDCGFDLLQTANSYSIQNGISSIQSTMNSIEQHGMLACGTFRTSEEREASGGYQLLEVNGIRFAVVAFTKGLNNMHLPDGCEYAVNLLYNDYDTEYSSVNETQILTCLENAKAADPDFIIALVHWGSENVIDVSDSQRQIADLLVDNGVDVILGSHSHLVGQIEHRYVQKENGAWKDVYIAYSLGDFLTSSEQSKSQFSCVFSLTFQKDSGSGFHAITDVSYTPTYNTSPSKSMGTNTYSVIDILNSLQLREEQYYDAISEAFAEKLTDVLDALKEQTETDYQIQKQFS